MVGWTIYFQPTTEKLSWVPRSLESADCQSRQRKWKGTLSRAVVDGPCGVLSRSNKEGTYSPPFSSYFPPTHLWRKPRRTRGRRPSSSERTEVAFPACSRGEGRNLLAREGRKSEKEGKEISKKCLRLSTMKGSLITVIENQTLSRGR